MENLCADDLLELLGAVGDHLAEAGEHVAIVVVGGTSLIARGWVLRATKDVDVIALADTDSEPRKLLSPNPLPDSLVAATTIVARDYDLPENWLNSEIGAQWESGLPPGLLAEVEWLEFGGLEVGLAGRRTLIALKLFAAVDQGESVHLQDLLALRPTEGELRVARVWVATQDAGEAFPNLIDQVIKHVHEQLRPHR